VNTTHTPGPWTYEVEKVSGPSLSDATFLFAHGDVIGKVYESAGQGNSQANACLAAAAPDLLEALREAMSAVRVFHGPVDWEIYRDRSPEMQRWRAAIAKATGSAA
jgi:hypothetical protein